MGMIQAFDTVSHENLVNKVKRSIPREMNHIWESLKYKASLETIIYERQLPKVVCQFRPTYRQKCDNLDIRNRHFWLTPHYTKCSRYIQRSTEMD